MENNLFAEILLTQKVGKDKDTLTYQISPELVKQEPAIGQIVEVPLRNKLTKGIIFNLHNKKPIYKTKPINRIITNAPHLNKYQLKLINWISEYYFCPLHKTLKLFLPSSFIKKKKINTSSLFEESSLELKFRHTLDDQQQKALEKITESTKNIVLLHGITGSGKTEIYLNMVEDILLKGKQALMLIPEISLTPQTQQRFRDHFNEQVVIIHSQLTARQKEEAWLRIYKGKSSIVIGSRSALFAPFKNLGIIIIDEEHDPSYKQDQSPRYHTVDTAKKIAEILNIKVIIGSATPSIESYYRAEMGEYELLELTKRPSKTKGKLPEGIIVDLREEFKKKNFSIFSELLQEKIAKKLQEKEQIILFLNRRGAATSVICRFCGFLTKCKRCEIPLTYHQKLMLEEGIYPGERLICHHCGLFEKVPKTCPQCDSNYIRYVGIGTQKVETELQKLFPHAKILRADRDTVHKKDHFKNIYEAFKAGQADILIGTQMISLGLHLPKVNLVGIILADIGLGIPNFRSAERTFQLITQVAGRAGREGQKGEVVIQTYVPNHCSITTAARHQYIEFYKQELNIRKELMYPPFSKIIKLTISDKNSHKCFEKTQNLFEILESANTNKKLKIHNYPALIPKLKNLYRWHILITGVNPKKLLQNVMKESSYSSHFENIAIDVDPLSII